jgi:molybdate transport system substrate-binding protein
MHFQKCDNWQQVTMQRRTIFPLLGALLLALTASAAGGAPVITIYGAASLTNVLQSLGESFTAATGVPVRFSFAASSQLARQIETGAPADVFFSADQEWMDYLDQRELIQQSTRHNVVGNRLVLIAPADSRLDLRIVPNFPLRAALGNERLATGDPDVVPAGRYARSALQNLGVWNDVANRLVRAENVRSAMVYVARGEAPLGIVYETDARVDPKVRIVDVFPASSHPPIAYPIALTRGASPAAARFIDYLRGPDGKSAFLKSGFIVLP